MPFDLNALEANYTPYYQDTPQAAPKKNDKKKKRNFWLDQISTVTGTLGGIGGGLLGGVGGAGIGAIPGAAIGGAAGGGLGEAIENIIDPQHGNWGNVAKEAALSGVLSAGPLKLAKAGLGARAAVQAGAETGEKIGLREALKTGSQAAEGFTLRGAAGKKVAEQGDKLLGKQFKLTPSQLFNFKNRHGEDAVAVIKRYGFNNADDVVTKGVEPLQNAFDEVVTKIPGIQRKSLESSLSKVYKPLMNSANLTEQNLGQGLKAQADEILKRSGDVIDASEINNLRKSFDNAVKYTQRGAPDFNVNKETADALRGVLQKAADKSGIGFQGKSFKEIGKDLTKLYDLNEIVARQENLGRGSSPLGLTNMLGGVLGGGAAGLPGAAVGAAMTGAVNSTAGRKAVAQGTEKLASGLLSSGERVASKAMNPLRIAGRQAFGHLAAGGLADAIQQAQSSSNNPSMPMNAQTTATPMSSNMLGEYQNGGEMSSGSPYSADNLMADLQRDPQNAEKYIDLFTTFQKLFAPPEQKPLNATQQQQSSNALSGLEDINLLSSEIGRDPNIALKNSLPGGGFTRRLTGATQYEAARQNVADVIGRLRSGGAINTDEERRFLSLLPQPGDSPQSANQKLSRVSSLLQRFAYPQPVNSLEEALLQYQ